MNTILFKELAVGDKFASSGTHWIKQSSRTARLVDGTRWFYFNANELCKIKE